MRQDQQIAIWMNIMMTAFRKRYGLSRSALAPIIAKYGLIPFLINQYELLHYYDNEYIVDDIEKYIVEQGGDTHELHGII